MEVKDGEMVLKGAEILRLGGVGGEG